MRWLQHLFAEAFATVAMPCRTAVYARRRQPQRLSTQASYNGCRHKYHLTVVGTSITQRLIANLCLTTNFVRTTMIPGTDLGFSCLELWPGAPPVLHILWILGFVAPPACQDHNISNNRKRCRLDWIDLTHPASYKRASVDLGNLHLCHCLPSLLLEPNT